LATAVKELVENALDAGATTIEVKLKEMGMESIEVSDNGVGIEQSNFAELALKHHTSKLSDFSDLGSIASFGFRGEALNALCELSHRFNVTTRQAKDSVGSYLEYGKDGR
jgi:DNA mismatch repair protein PMS2